jgi:hypothetical protein
MSIKGTYHDILIDSQNNRLFDSGWKNNRIVDSCHILNAALFRNPDLLKGVQFLAVGNGLPAWDSHIAVPTGSERVLQNEVFRCPVTPDNISFEDSSGLCSSVPSSILRINATITYPDLNGGDHRLREFGLFGGNATKDPNSGYMIDYVIHPRIDVSDGMSLQREVRLSMGGQSEAITSSARTVFGGELPISLIDGIGARYMSILQAAGVRIIDDLARITLINPLPNLPLIVAQELRSKARLVIRPRTEPAPLMIFQKETIVSFLGTAPRDLVLKYRECNISESSVASFQDELSILQVSLDSKFLQTLTVGNYIEQSKPFFLL